jgi:predicted enzyme related to lactoylglutathione lyase
MGEVEHYSDGTFCWVDLGTTDASAAKEFYGGLFGWEFEDLPTGEHGTYTICRRRGKLVCGLYDQADEPGWGSYVSVADVDDATSRARELGADVIVEPFGTPGGGRVATLRDPAGPVVSLSKPGENFGAELVNEDGTWSWNELVRVDLSAAKDFYGELLGWSAEDAPGSIARTTFTRGDLLIGGGHARLRRRIRRRGGAWPSGWPTPTRPLPRSRSWAGRSCFRRWTSLSAGSRSSRTRSVRCSRRPRSPADPPEVSTGPDT